MVSSLLDDGLNIEMHTYEGAQHAFDYTKLWPGRTLVYDKSVDADAEKRIATFLKKVF